MKKLLSIILTLLMLVGILASCTSNESYQSIERGFLETTDGGMVPVLPAVYCGYKIDKNQFEDDSNIPISLYYGIDTSKRKNENNVPGPFVIRFWNSKDQSTVLKEHTLQEMFSGEYDVTETTGEKTSDGRHNYLHISFTHCEEIEIPSYMFDSEEGYIVIEIHHKTENPRYGYGKDIEYILYKKAYGKIYLFPNSIRYI